MLIVFAPILKQLDNILFDFTLLYMWMIRCCDPWCEQENKAFYSFAFSPY